MADSTMLLTSLYTCTAQEAHTNMPVCAWLFTRALPLFLDQPLDVRLSVYTCSDRMQGLSYLRIVLEFYPRARVQFHTVQFA